MLYYTYKLAAATAGSKLQRAAQAKAKAEVLYKLMIYQCGLMVHPNNRASNGVTPLNSRSRRRRLDTYIVYFIYIRSPLPPPQNPSCGERRKPKPTPRYYIYIYIWYTWVGVQGQRRQSADIKGDVCSSTLNRFSYVNSTYIYIWFVIVHVYKLAAAPAKAEVLYIWYTNVEYMLYIYGVVHIYGLAAAIYTWYTYVGCMLLYICDSTYISRECRKPRPKPRYYIYDICVWDVCYICVIVHMCTEGGASQGRGTIYIWYTDVGYVVL